MMKTPQRILVVVAHQDDDAFIVSRLREQLAQGAEIFVVWTSTSRYLGPRFGLTRIHEAQIALQFLGVPSANGFFLGYSDRETVHHLPEQMRDLTPIVAYLQPDVVYVPAYEGGHIDHDVAHVVTVFTLRQMGLHPTIYEFPLYSGYQSGWLPSRLRNYPVELPTTVEPLSAEAYRFVCEYVRIYRSQYPLLDWYIRLASGYPRTFGYTYDRPLPNYDYRQPPPSGIAYHKYLIGAHYADFEQAVAALY